MILPKSSLWKLSKQHASILLHLFSNIFVLKNNQNTQNGGQVGGLSEYVAFFLKVAYSHANWVKIQISVIFLPVVYTYWIEKKRNEEWIKQFREKDIQMKLKFVASTR